MYWIPVIISLVITLIASARVNSTYSKYKKIANSRGMTGAEAARQMLWAHGITNVAIEQTAGRLTDHYNPSNNTIYLSEEVFNSPSVASVGIAMHETGHAIQHAEGYTPVRIRSAIVQSTNISSWVSYLFVMLGIVFSAPQMITIGIIAFCAVIFFQLVTLPVEFNASARAINDLKASGMFGEDEISCTKDMLSAAAMTYVAAVAVSLIHLLRLLAIRGRR